MAKRKPPAGRRPPAIATKAPKPPTAMSAEERYDHYKARHKKTSPPAAPELHPS